jgi:two-component system, sensor histidine kinase PdtaS
MPYHYYLLVIFILLLSCGDKKNNLVVEQTSLLLLMDTAKNNKLAPEKRLDAAQKAYSTAAVQKDVKKQIESIRICSMLYLSMDSTELALAFYRQLDKLAKKIADKESEGVALSNIGLIFNEQSLYDSAIIYLEKAGKIFLQSGDSLRFYQGRINMGIAYKNIGAFEKAFTASMEAASIMGKMEPSEAQASAFNTLGNTLIEMQRPNEALEYHQKALAIRTKLADSTGIAGSFNNIGNVYKNKEQYAKAQQYYTQSLQLKRQLGMERSIPTTVDNIAETYMKMKQYNKAEQYATEALSLRDTTDDKDGWMTAANTLASIYLERKEFAKAEALSKRIEKIAQEPIYKRHQLTNSLLLEKIYAEKKDYIQAHRYAAKALDLKDSLFNADMTDKISTMNVRFKTEEQQKKIELSEKNAIINTQKIKKQNYFMLLMASVILLLVLAAYLLYQSAKHRKKSREKTELLMTELNHRIKNNLQIISDILNLQSSVTSEPGELNALQAGRNRIQSIGIVHNLLYQKEYNGNINLAVFLEQMTKNLEHVLNTKSKKDIISLSSDAVWIKPEQAVPVGLIINELITNVYKYGSEAAIPTAISITAEQQQQQCQIVIKDDGKPWDMKAAREQKTGLGLKLVAMLVQQLKGSWHTTHKDHKNIHTIIFQLR